MVKTSVEITAPPAISRRMGEHGHTLLLQGFWNLRGLALSPRLQHEAGTHAGNGDIEWDLRGIEALDSAGAFVLWAAWGERLPERIQMRQEHERVFVRLQNRRIPAEPGGVRGTPMPEHLVRMLRGFFEQVLAWVTLLGQILLDLGYLARHPRDIPWREISATIHETGGRALGITALVGFLIGVVVSYLSSLQLRTFGAAIYIVNILGMSIIRELGPLLAAILVAGRSGSAMTAQLGVMRVTQELDALAALGISHSLRLVLPKVIALSVAMPLLVVWTDVIALIGGALAAHFELDINLYQFLLKLPSAVPVLNFTIGLLKGVVFGLFIALVACHFGLRIKPDTESLGKETTNSVVTAITLVILLDAVFAILFKGVGLR